MGVLVRATVRIEHEGLIVNTRLLGGGGSTIISHEKETNGMNQALPCSE